MHTIELSTFLQGLRDNNTKDWFEAHRSTYESLRQEFTDLVQDIIDQSVQFDVSLTGLNARSCLFRINRDIRFSRDKSPYKTAFSAALSGSSKHELHAGYYLRLDADGMLTTGAGIHGLMPPDVLKVRHYIADHYRELDKILEAATRAGFAGLHGEKLVSVPRGFAADHPAGDYLKYKEFTIGHEESIAELSVNLAGHIADLFHAAHPFKEFMTEATRG